MNQAEIQEKAAESIVQSNALQQRYSGYMSLYNAACVENNKPEQERIRESLIAVLGQMLDNTAWQYDLARQQRKLSGNESA